MASRETLPCYEFQKSYPSLATDKVNLKWRLNAPCCDCTLSSDRKCNSSVKQEVVCPRVCGGLSFSYGERRIPLFGERKDLVFPLAIHQPDAMRHDFRATFAAFGISGIPWTAVIDVEGCVSYLGDFDHAIEVAGRLAGTNP